MNPTLTGQCKDTSNTIEQEVFFWGRGVLLLKNKGRGTSPGKPCAILKELTLNPSIYLSVALSCFTELGKLFDRIMSP